MATYGEEATVGLWESIQTDYMSSEHSDSGAATKEEWDTVRKSQDAGDNAWEIRKLDWRSQKVCQNIHYQEARSPVVNSSIAYMHALTNILAMLIEMELEDQRLQHQCRVPVEGSAILDSVE